MVVDQVLGDATFARNAGATGQTLRDAGGYRLAADIGEVALR